MKSLKYEGPEIEEYFSTHRTTWDDFYPSERSLIEAVWPVESPRILDIGSACGGLGLALQERFGTVSRYTGIELNTQAVETARRLNSSARFIEGDFLQIERSELDPQGYDLVFSLSCVDWQVNTLELLKRAWEMVSPGGLLILSLRLTLDQSSIDFSKSFQFINYQGLSQGEKAPYVVLNAGEVAATVKALGARGLRAHGYWGPPSSTAITPYSSLCFTVLALAKGLERLGPTWELELPEEVAASLENSLDG